MDWILVCHRRRWREDLSIRGVGIFFRYEGRCQSPLLYEFDFPLQRSILSGLHVRVQSEQNLWDIADNGGTRMGLSWGPEGGKTDQPVLQRVERRVEWRSVSELVL